MRNTHIVLVVLSWGWVPGGCSWESEAVFAMQMPESVVKAGARWTAPAVWCVLAVELIIAATYTDKAYRQNAFGIRLPRGTIKPTESAALGPKFLQDIHALRPEHGKAMSTLMQAGLQHAWREAVSRCGARLTDEQDTWLRQLRSRGNRLQDGAEGQGPG